MLYTKKSLCVRHAASTDPTRYNLCAVHFLKGGATEATDGHMLMRLDPAPVDQASTLLDQIPSGDVVPFIGAIDGVEMVAKMIPKKTKTGIDLHYAALDVAETNRNGSADFVVHEIGNPIQRVKVAKIDGEYPNTGQVVPKPAATDRTFAINMALLDRVYRAVKELQKGERVVGRVKVTVPAPDPKYKDQGVLSPITIEATSEEGDTLSAYVMPMRL